MVKVKFKKDSDAFAPFYATPGAAGFDLAAKKQYILSPGETKVVGTGLYFEIPVGYELQVRPRSGTSLKTAIRLANSPGTVDSDYRGEVGIIVTNTSPHTVLVIDRGERIAQGVIKEVPEVVLFETDELTETERGTGGYGSTGK